MVRCKTAIWPNENQFYRTLRKWVVINTTTNNTVVSFFLLASHSTLLVAMDQWVAKAVEFLHRNPSAMVPKSMAAAQLFSSSKCANRTIQQQVCRAYKKWIIPSSISVPSLSTNSTISSLTNPFAAPLLGNDHPDHDALSALVEQSNAGSAISAGQTSAS